MKFFEIFLMIARNLQKIFLSWSL